VPATPRAPVTPALLRWAREEAALTLDAAASKLRIPPDRLETWEEGSARPTLNQLKAAARVYAQPPAVFFLREPPRTSRPDIPDYRRGHRGGEEHPDTRRELKEALARRREFLALRDDVHPFALAIGQGGPSDQVAALAREQLRVEVNNQFEARDQYAALNLWLRAVEQLDVLVFQASTLGADDMRGISVFLNPAPVVLLRGKDAPAGRVFTLAHELGHLVRRTNALCDPFHPASAEVERWCNAFAADLLMPIEPFVAELRRHSDVPAVDAAYSLGRRFGVSQEAAAVRMVGLNLAPRAVIDEARAQTAEALLAIEEREGFAPYHRMRMRDLGRLYTSTVVEAYHGDRIGLTDAIQRLGVKVPTFRRIEAELPAPP
jgi:Zn-dependent peptidase ImmA (M78 family)